MDHFGTLIHVRALGACCSQWSEQARAVGHTRAAESLELVARELRVVAEALEPRLCPRCGVEYRDPLVTTKHGPLCPWCAEEEFPSQPRPDPSDERMASLEAAWARSLVTSLGLEEK